jgi:hypothetical protein
VQVFGSYCQTLATSQRFDGEHTVFHLSKHLLYSASTTNRIQVTSLILSGIKCSRKLLMNTHNNLQPFSIQLKCFGEGSGFTLNKSFRGHNHEILDLSLVNINFTSNRVMEGHNWV